jgi:hypothetical protein
VKFVECTYEEACVALLEGYKIRKSAWDIGYYLQFSNGRIVVIDTINDEKHYQTGVNLDPRVKYQKEVTETILTISEIEKALGIKHLKVVKDK